MGSRDAASEVLQLLGLARRAGAVAAGTQRVRDALLSRRARLVLVAGDASPAQLEKLDGVLRHAKVPSEVLGDRVSLGAAVGTSPLSAVAVTDPRLAEQMLRRLDGEKPAEP